MIDCHSRLCRLLAPLLAFLVLAFASGPAPAGDDAQLLSVSVSPGTAVMPRSTFTQTWTFLNTGTTAWSAGRTGYTLNIRGMDSLGAMPLYTNTTSLCQLAAVINGGKTVKPGAQASYTLMFIAPEASGAVTDLFQLNGADGNYFGPTVSVPVVVVAAGSTNQYDRARAVSYANNYAGYVCSDGYFWTNGSSYGQFVPLSNAPASSLGDDCAHFVSSCIGSQAGTNRGGGLKIPSRVPPTYGDPGAGRLVNNCLLDTGYAVEVLSLTNMEPGDVIGWNWEGDTNIANLDHVTLYVGNGLLASHSASALDVGMSHYVNSTARWHFIHILDAPTLVASKSGSKLILSWGTNWNGYALYAATSLSPGASWVKVARSPSALGKMNVITNTMTPAPGFFRLLMP